MPGYEENCFSNVRPDRPSQLVADQLRPFLPAEAALGELLRELIEEVKGLRADLKMHELRTGQRLIGQ